MRNIPLLALVAVCILTGCGTQQSASGNGTTLRVWYSTDDATERAWAQTLARRFETGHPGIHVQFTVLDFEDLNTKLQLALQGGNPPDLAYVTPRGPGIPVYVGAHQLRDLTAAARSHGWAAKLRPGLLASYNQPFGLIGAQKGHIVAVPAAMAAVGILYNKRLLARLHLQVPASLAAFERDLARAKRAGYTPLGIGNGDGWLGDDWYLTLVNALLPPASLEPEQFLDPHFSFRRPPFLRAGTILQRWAKSDYLTPNFGGLDAQEGVDVFFRGKTLFQLISSSENSQILQDQRDTKLPVGYFAFPTTREKRTVPASGYLGWVVPKAAQHPAAAVSFIDSLLSQQTAKFLVQHGVAPAMKVAVAHAAASWQESELQALQTAQPGLYLDAAPVSNLNATMEANVQLLLQGYEGPQFLTKSLQEVYRSHGKTGSAARIDGEF